MGTIAADITCNEILRLKGIKDTITRDSDAFIQSLLIGTFLVVVIVTIVTMIWLCIFQKEKRKIMYELIIGTMVVVQIVIMNRASRWMAADWQINVRHEYTIIVFSALLSDFVFVILILEERKNTKMNARLKELEYIQAL